ncbi:hypothetical protein SDC9_156100 [bioreactor metagenome]|uniref:Lcl C-terminal domain-containing protein n=1 Tax=bioreactor metagenome TaxID=1076179 RepID=A0A645F3B9_9ZZZZ
MIKRITLIIIIVVFGFVVYNRLNSFKTEWGINKDVVETDGLRLKGGDMTVFNASPYNFQSFQAQDDNLGTYKNEESVWTNQPDGIVGKTGLSSGRIKKDERTGLWWSASSLSNTITNNLDVVETDGLRLKGGDAIAFCDGLNTVAFGGKTDWYLPTQKELMQAYIDGIYSQDPEFGTMNAFWASTVLSTDLKTPWCVHLAWGFVFPRDKFISDYFVRCVRRD